MSNEIDRYVASRSTMDINMIEDDLKKQCGEFVCYDLTLGTEETRGYQWPLATYSRKGGLFGKKMISSRDLYAVTSKKTRGMNYKRFDAHIVNVKHVSALVIEFYDDKFDALFSTHIYTTGENPDADNKLVQQTLHDRYQDYMATEAQNEYWSEFDKIEGETIDGVTHFEAQRYFNDYMRFILGERVHHIGERPYSEMNLLVAFPDAKRIPHLAIACRPATQYTKEVIVSELWEVEFEGNTIWCHEEQESNGRYQRHWMISSKHVGKEKDRIEIGNAVSIYVSNAIKALDKPTEVRRAVGQYKCDLTKGSMVAFAFAGVVRKGKIIKMFSMFENNKLETAATIRCEDIPGSEIEVVRNVNEIVKVG